MTGSREPPDITRAIRRAAAARTAMRKRRRRTLAVLVGLPFGALVSFGVWTASASGVDVVHAASRNAQDLLQLLDQRSPGIRTAAQLTKMRRLEQRNAGDLASRRSAPVKPILHDKQSLGDLLAGAPNYIKPESAGSFALLESNDIAGLIAGGGGGADDSVPSIGGPGTEASASLPSGESRVPLVDTPAVPEPQTWALMLVGFALIGWKVRRRPSSAVRAGRNR